MTYEAAYEKALEQLMAKKKIDGSIDRTIRVGGREFHVQPVSGFPKTCNVVGCRGSKISCIASVDVNDCSSDQEAKKLVAEKIAESVCKPNEFWEEEVKAETNPYFGKRWYAEIIKNSANFYRINMVVNGRKVEGLSELVRYRSLRDEVWLKTRIELPMERELIYIPERGKGLWRACLDATQERKDFRVTEEEFRAGWKPNMEVA